MSTVGEKTALDCAPVTPIQVLIEQCGHDWGDKELWFILNMLELHMQRYDVSMFATPHGLLFGKAVGRIVDE